MATVSTSLLRRKLLRSLVMVCKCLDLAGEVDAPPFVPLLRDLFARSHASKALDVEGGEISKDNQLIYLGGSSVSFVCCLKICLDLFP